MGCRIVGIRVVKDNSVARDSFNLSNPSRPNKLRRARGLLLVTMCVLDGCTSGEHQSPQNSSELSASQPVQTPAAPPVPDNSSKDEILGTHYSNKLFKLIQHVEKTADVKVEFVPRTSDGDNNVSGIPGGKYRIQLKPGSPEDDVAHELMHILLEKEGFARTFPIPGDVLAQQIQNLIKSDFDHLIINQRLHQEGYSPEKGFMLGMRDQYRNFVSAKFPVSSVPQANVLIGVSVIHELMKQVYYVESPEAERAILGAYPTYRTKWQKIKTLIDSFIKAPTPASEWKFVVTYNGVMDTVYKEAGMPSTFSDNVGFRPLPVLKSQLEKPASNTLTFTQDPTTQIVRIKAKGIMVSANIGDVPNLALPLRDVATAQHIPLLVAQYSIKSMQVQRGLQDR
jgi:hypothetical protein